MENWAYMLAADLDIFEMVILVVLLGLSAIGSAIQKARKQKAEREARQKATERRDEAGSRRPAAAAQVAVGTRPPEGVAQHQQELVRRRREQELAKKRRQAAAIVARERAEAQAREAARRAAQESQEATHRVVEDVLPVGAAAAPSSGSALSGPSDLRSGQGLRQAIILHEIFSPPKALRGEDEWSA